MLVKLSTQENVYVRKPWARGMRTSSEPWWCARRMSWPCPSLRSSPGTDSTT